MGRRRVLVRVLTPIAVLLATSLLTAGTALATVAPHPLETALFHSATDGATLARIRGTGVSYVRINMEWRAVAPAQPSASFDPTNPADPQYQWVVYDRLVSAALSHGLQPFVTIFAAPDWAQRGPPATPYANSYMPDPNSFAQFALAVARRYSGTFDGLPRVRYYQAWNEPNISLYPVPQLVGGQPVSPGVYREMLNGFADAVHSVNAGNVVVAAGLAPFRDITAEVQAQDSDWGPLSFMRALLCLGPNLKPTCNAPVKFDVWAQHPYTSGGPLHHAVLPNDVSLGDLPKVRRVLAAAESVGHIVSASGAPKLWVTEFSWDSNPPDPAGVPIKVETRWVSEALYRMWLNDVDLVTWLQLADSPMATSYYQSGPYYYGATLAESRPKPILEAFRFPFVAYRSGKSAAVWGRTPWGRQSGVVVEQRVRRRWLRLTMLRTDRYGVFQTRVALRSAGLVRARLATTGETSVPFSLTLVPDHFYNPFGLPTLLEPPKPK